jgi:aspartate aminotransferase
MTTEIKLAQRALQMPASPIRRLAPFAVAAEKAGRKVYSLNIGQPDIASPPEILDRLQTFDQPNVAYGPSQGLPEFVEAIRRYYARWQLEIAAEEIFVTTGGSEALLFTFAAIADHGDDVLVFEPFYTNYSGFAALVGVNTVPVTTRAEDGYHLPSREAIEERIGRRTRAIMLCSPNNPTGTVYTDAELEMIGAICRDRGLFLVADEVYREFTYDGLKHRSAMTLEGLREQVVLTDSLSKRVSLCGARIGWIATHNRGLLECVLKFGQARLCPPTLGQYIGSALNDVPEAYMQEVIGEYERRRNLVYDALRKTAGVTVKRPEGAFYVCARLPVDDAQRFCEFLLRDFELDGETVMLAPADGFYATPGLGRDEVRIAYVLEQGALARAMRIIGLALQAYPGRVAV